MDTKEIMEIEETNRNRPSTIRLIAGIIALLCGTLVFGGCCYGMWLFVDFRYEELWIFEYTWGKLLILFVSGMIFLISMGILSAFALKAITIWMGKSRMMKHLICPFPTVLTTELAHIFNMERFDDEFLIFNPDSLVRSTYLVIGGILSCVGIVFIYQDMNDPFSQLYWPPASGGILASFFLFLHGLLTPSQCFVLDRMNGTVTFPRHLFFPRRTIPFSKVIPGYSNGNLCFAHPNSGIVLPVLGAYDSGWWAFYVLYMDKNRPLPQGDAFDPYREKDFLRRKAEGFPKPIYPSISLVTDAYMGYIYGTDEFKQRLSKMKYGIIHCYTRVSWFCQNQEIKYEKPNDLVLIGIWKKQYVFKLFAPENVEYIIIPDNAVLRDCFLCDGDTAEVEYIK